MLVRAVSGFLRLFRDNLRSEYETNGLLKGAMESLVRRCHRYRDTRLWGVGSAVLEQSLNAMKLSDMCIRSLAPARKRALTQPYTLQKRLDGYFVLPQYYGGLKDANLLYYGAEARKRETSRAVETYKGGIAKSLLRIVFGLKSLLGLDGSSETVSQIENLLVPEIFGNLGGDWRSSCTERGTADIRQMLSEIRQRAGSSEAAVVCADVRRTETSVEDGAYKCQFELEVEAFGADYARLSLVVSAVFFAQQGGYLVLDRLSWEFL
jgi:hypothetical protein